MDVVLKIESKDAQKVKDALNKDEITSRASITFRDGAIIGKDGQLCRVSGTEEQCRRAIEITKNVAKEADEKDAKEFVAKLDEEESKAGEGLGGIFV